MKTGTRGRDSAPARVCSGSGEAGFTLAELLVALVASVVVLGVVFSVYIGQQRNFLVGNSYLDVHQDARNAMDSMTRDIRWATAAVASRTINGTLYTTSSTCIVLRLPSIYPSPVPTTAPTPVGGIIDVANQFDYFVYRLNGHTLERVVDENDGIVTGRKDGTLALADKIDSLTFTLLNSSGSTTTSAAAAYAVRIALIAKKTVKAGKSINVSEHLDTTVKFRNIS